MAETAATAPDVRRQAASRFDARMFSEAAALGAGVERLKPRGRRPFEDVLGAHGRKRPGPGASFWQYRPYQPGESARAIDWRRSARGDQAIVREREWEAALTLDVWVDVSGSMAFPPEGGAAGKQRVADVIALAAASAWIGNGERIRVIGDPKRSAVSSIPGFARALARAGAVLGADASDLPPAAPGPRQGFVLLIGDFMAPPERLARRVEDLARNDARGVAIQTLHPLETDLDLSGRVEFASVEAGDSHLLRQVESGRERYLARLESHRQDLANALGRFGWSLIPHRTDRPHGPALAAAMAALAQARRGNAF